MKNFGKANFPVAFRPTSAFPLDARCVFDNLASAEAAASTAEEIGSTNTVYHFGMQILVSDDEGEKWYTIQRNKTLLPIGSGTDILNKILDPERYPIAEDGEENSGESQVITVALEVGKLSREDGSNRDEGSGLRTPDFIPVQGGTSIYPVYEKVDAETNMCFLFYDSSYGLVKAWNDGLNYRYADSGTEILCPVEAAYTKAYYSVEATEGTLTVTTAAASPEKTVRAEHKKIFIADHGYVIYGDIIDTDKMHKLVIEAEGKDDNEYNIVEVKAPSSQPDEATLCLMNWGNGQKQFVDFSSMVYGGEPTVEIVCQTRGGLPLPEFSVRYNDGNGAGRVKKFVVQPDAIPVELTSEGIRVRRNNNYDNSGDDSEFVTVNLVDLYDRELPTVTEDDNNKIMQVKNGVWVATPAEDYINKLIDDYLSEALNAEY